VVSFCVGSNDGSKTSVIDSQQSQKSGQQIQQFASPPRDDLVGQIAVASNTEEKRLVDSRLIRFDHTDALVSDHREYQPILLASEFKWRILGRVLWWTGKPG
jgi:hypothetical protein